MSTDTIKISEELRAKIVAKLEKLGNPTMYYGQGDGFSDKQIEEAIEKEPECPLNYLENELIEYNDTYELEVDHLKYALDYFDDEIAEQNDLNQDEMDMKDIASELRDDFLDHLGVDTNIKSLCRSNINVRVSMYSNYDCINSHWLESQEGYRMDSYFGDMVRQLGLNPQKVKGMLFRKGLKTYGNWPKRSDKNALVSYEDFWQELENTSCGANLLTFVGEVDMYEFLKLDHTKPMKVTIGKGNNVGLFSHMQGGGSVIEMALLRPVTIELNKALDNSGYLKYGMSIDNSSDRHSISSVYGVTSAFWGGEIKVEQA